MKTAAAISLDQTAILFRSCSSSVAQQLDFEMSDTEEAKGENGGMDKKVKKQILALFHKFDENGDGKLTQEELSGILGAVSGGTMPEEEINELFEKLDRDDNGRLTVSEFLDYVFDDDSAAGIAVESADRLVEYAKSEQASQIMNTLESAYNSELGQELADRACDRLGIDKEKVEAVAGAVGSMVGRAVDWWSD